MKGKRIIILIVLFFTLAFQSVNAQEMSITAAPTPTPITYALPYPGILPGHPFYFMKTIRDVMWGFFISNPLKKAEFNLLQADKGFATSQSLFGKTQDTALVISALDQASNYFENAMSKSEDAKRQGMNNQELLHKLTLANEKHQDVVTNMTKEIKGEDQKRFAHELERVKNFGKKLQSLQRK